MKIHVTNPLLLLVLVSATGICYSQDASFKKFQIGLAGGTSVPVADYSGTDVNWNPDRGYAKIGFFAGLEGVYWITRGIGVGIAGSWMQHGFNTQTKPCEINGTITFNGNPWQIAHAMPILSFRTKRKVMFVGDVGAGFASIGKKEFNAVHDPARCSDIYNYQSFPSKVSGIVRVGGGVAIPIGARFSAGLHGHWYYSYFKTEGRRRSGHVNVTEMISVVQSDIDISILNIGFSLKANL